MSILCSRLYKSFKYSLLQLTSKWPVKSPYFGAQQHRAYSETIPGGGGGGDDDDDDNNNNNKTKNILKYKNLTIEI